MPIVPMRFLATGCLLLSLFWVSGSVAIQQSSATAVQEAFLSDEAGPEQYLALLEQPELIRQRAVQAKLLRGLRDDDMEIFKAAAGVAMRFPEIDFNAPRVWRRLETTFLGEDADRKLALLELALQSSEYREDLRIVGLVADALLQKGSDLAATALQLADQDSTIASNPAVAEALSSAQGRNTGVSLPDFEAFKQEIAPILTTPGPDATACVECHKNRTILHLKSAEELADESERVQHYYRSILRVIDLKEPENSLLVRKPTRPAPQTQPAPASLQTHTGGARFQVGDETYQKIIGWIKEQGNAEG